MDLVSVLLPVYNVEEYIEESLNSLLNQTYKNIEIIIVDDASTDNTYRILQKLQKKDKRIKLYKNKKNKKIAETLNIAFLYSEGDYICRMDGDDVSDPERIERKIEFLRNNKDIALVGCSVKSIDENGILLGYKKMLSQELTIHKTLKYATPVFHIWLAKREVYEKLRGYRNIPYVEDYDFLLRMTTLGYKYTNIDDYYGYAIRIRRGNTISSAGVIQRKAHRYCYKLYKKRSKGNEDDEFSLDAFNAYVKTNSLEFKLFNISNRLLQKTLFIKKGLSLRKILFGSLAFLLSREQRKYINGRLIVWYVTKFNS